MFADPITKGNNISIEELTFSCNKALGHSTFTYSYTCIWFYIAK